MASIYGTDGGTLTPYGRRPTNAGYPGYGGYGGYSGGHTSSPSSGGETRPNGDGTFGGHTSDPFGGVTDSHTPGTGPGPYGSPTTGTTGGTTQTGTPTTTTQAPNFGWLMGYDYGKLNDPTHTSAKYQIGRTLAQYDPRYGFSPEVLNALNALGFGKFSGSGDRLTLDGVTQAGINAGLDPHSFTGDFIYNWTGADPNDHSGARWTYDAYQDPATMAATDPTAALTSLFAPPAQTAMPDLSWIGQLMQAFQPQQAAPAYAPPPVAVPVTQPTASQPTPTFGGGYVTPGYGSVGDATSHMSLSLQQLLSDPRYANDPLAQRILAMIGGH